jgi:hypothetical protein
MGDDCDTNHYLVVAKVMDDCQLSKQAAQKFNVVRFNLRKGSWRLENRIRL